MLRRSVLAVCAALLVTACSSTSGVPVDELSALAAAAQDKHAADAATTEVAPAAEEPAAKAAPPALSDGEFVALMRSPQMLRDRRMPTRSKLPPPVDGAFASSIGPVTAELRQRMGESWSSACPVDLTDLRYVTVSFRGFDGLAHTGELVLAAHVAQDVVTVFRKLFDVGFPIEEMRLVTTQDHHAPKTGDGNSTAAYNCRSIRGSSRWSEHALGTAVDINPFHNPMLKRGTVVPELATAYVDRTNIRPGMVVEPGVAVEAFAKIGWKWGGHWNSHKDWMHFSAGGS